MGAGLIKIGEIQARYFDKHPVLIKDYIVEMDHEGLDEHILISAQDKEVLIKKVDLQENKWAEKWETEEARRNIEQMEYLLLQIMSIDNTVDWEKLKVFNRFPEEKPIKPIVPVIINYPSEPDHNSEEFTPVFSIWDELIKFRIKEKIKQYQNKYENALKIWEQAKDQIDNQNKKNDIIYQEKLKKWEIKYKEWETRLNDFYRKQGEYNTRIGTLKESYFDHRIDAIIEYCEIVLNNSKYPEFFPKHFELEYLPESKILIVEYSLPPMEILPRIKEVKYIARRNELQKYYLSDLQLNKMFDDVMYKITLRTLYELFKADSANAIEAISFNGWIKSTNKATGKQENNCILSIQVKKNEFTEVDLAKVDPKICFKKFKGVGSSKLYGLTPIQPILQISKTDKRFIEAYNVAETLNDATNIAAMDWEDFEHLIRELFEKEFSVNGGEVKVTQASRDGGVDAVAFDPDPIRGGKIVIQAKRYTNTVGVSAVRDLYGTVMNEGATKGILVTTADYGPDAYEFAKGKPLTLLSGANLLYLLEKHGHRAKIDLKEAKLILAEKGS